MIIICGSGRSGTSAVAGLLHAAGIALGHDLIEADEHNAEGYFEERPVIELNEAILNDVGLNRWFSAASREEVLAAAREREPEMRPLVEDATPAWKDPRFSWTLEGWLPVLRERPRVIVCLRSPLEVVASTVKIYGSDTDEAHDAVLHVWRAQYERLLDVIDDYGLEATCVEYGALHAEPERVLPQLEQFVGCALAASSVRSDLRHHAREVPPELQGLYDRVRALGSASPRVAP